MAPDDSTKSPNLTHAVALLLNRLVLASIAKGGQSQHDIPADERITDADIDKIKSEAMEHVRAVAGQRDQLRSALAALVGVDGREDLEQMEATMRLLPMPAQDRAQTIDAIHALIATLPEGQ